MFSRKIFTGVARLFLAIGILTLPVLSPALASEGMIDWQFFAEVSAPADFFLIPLTGPVYDEVRDDLGDLRILDEKGEETPYYIQRPLKQAGTTLQTGRIFNKGSREGEYTTFTVAMGTLHEPVNRLELIVEGENFFRRIRVEGSMDQQEWVLIQSSHHIFDSRDVTIARNTVITFDDITFPYLRVTIQDEGQTPLHVTGALFGYEMVGQAEEVSLSAGIAEEWLDEEKNENHLVLDLQHRFPSHRLVVSVAGENFNRRVRVYGSYDRNVWQQLGSGMIYRYTVENLHDSSLNVNYAEGRFRWLKLVFENGSNKPLPVTSVEVFSLPHALLTQGQGSGTYRLYYGAPLQAAPKYDLASFAPFVNRENLPENQLSAPQKNPSYLPPGRPWSEENPWLLWSVLGFLVLVLGAIIVRGIQHVS